MYQYVKDRFFDAYILYKVESVRNKDLNLYVSQPCDLFFLYFVRQCAKKRGRRKANHLLTFALIIDILAFLDRLVFLEILDNLEHRCSSLQKGGVPAAPSGTATLLRLSPSYRYYLRTLLAVACFRYSRLPWLDGRCVQGPGTYSPRHG